VNEASERESMLSGQRRALDGLRDEFGPREVAAPRGTQAPCTVHSTHQPTSHINEKHHIWPQEYSGPTVPENLVVVCATGHNSIHDLLAKWLKTGGDPGWDVQRHYTRGERELAKLGYDRIKRGAL